MDEALKELNRRMLKGALENRIPLTGSFELTARCNFKCSMCYVRSGDEGSKLSVNELSADDWIDIGRQARDAGLLSLTLTGGEVLVRKDFPTIYESLSNMGLIISIYTNGSLIDPTLAGFLSKIPPAKVSITLYGSNAETYQKITGSPGNFDSVMKGLDLLKTNGIRIELKTTVLRQNFDEFEEMAKLAEERFEAPLYIVNYISPRRDASGTNNLDCRLSPVELALYEKRVEAFNRRHKKIKATLDTHDIPEKSIGLFSSDAFRCHAGKCAFWVTADGSLTPCGLLCEPSCQVLEKGFKYAWERLKKDLKDVPQCEECSECALYKSCLSCPARRMAETGSFQKKVPYFCTLSHMSEQLKTTGF